MVLATSASADQKRFQIEQGNRDWAILISGIGTALIGHDMALLKFNHVNIENNPRYRKAQHVRSLTLGLATYNDEGQWYLAHKAASVQLNKKLAPGHIYTMRDIQHLFELQNEHIAGYWLAVELTLENGSTVYAHSQRDLFH